MLTAARNLIRSSSFTLSAVATLALGIAASTALFTVVNAVLLTPLPFPRASDLYAVRTYFPDGRFTSGMVAAAEVLALQRVPGVAGAAAALRVDSTIARDAEVRPVTAYGVSERFFELFQLPLPIGRGFLPADHVPRAPGSVVLSHRLWTSAFGSRSDIAGTSVAVNGRPMTIVGVAPAELDRPEGADLWFNIALSNDDIGHVFDAYMRLEPGVAVASLRDPLAAAMQALGRRFPDQNVGRAYAVRPLLTQTVGDLAPVLLIVFGATGLLLLLATFNVANLTLARGAAASRDVALRLALGASRQRSVRECLAEALLISAIAGVVGTLAAFGFLKIALQFGADRLARVGSVHLDGRVLGFVLLAVVAATIIPGVLPALRSAGLNTSMILNEGGRALSASTRTRRTLRLFTVAEIAFSVLLVATAIRLIRSYDNLQNVDLGFQVGRQLVIDTMRPFRPGTPPEFQDRWSAAIEERLKGLGARHVAFASSLPLQRELDSTTFADVLSRRDPPENRPNGRRRTVSAGFFQAMGIPLLRGRTFSPADGPDGERVAIVNEAFVRRFLPGRDPLSERLGSLTAVRVGNRFQPVPARIVGVARDVRFASVAAPAEPTIYLPITQSFVNRWSIVVTMPDGDPERYVPAIRAALRELDPSAPAEFSMLADRVTPALNNQRVGMLSMSAFGIAALILAMVGIFGVVAFGVAQRQNEMAIRLALGATGARLFWMMLGESGRTIAAGTIVGGLGAIWMGALMSRYVYQVSPADVRVLFESAAVVAAAALLASCLPIARLRVAAPRTLWRM